MQPLTVDDRTSAPTALVILDPPKDLCNGCMQDCTNLSVCVNNVPLMQIDSSFEDKSTKFLGIYIDMSLSWRHHVNYINNKIARALYAIKQATHVLPIESLLTLYFAFIQPHTVYHTAF